MNIVTTIKEWQAVRQQLNGRTIGFVPTMGHLHLGHASLYQRAKKENEVVVASLFVNPVQFNQPSDFELYPRTLEEDILMLESLHVDYLFAPDRHAMYPDDYQVQIQETELSFLLEGEFRPGHFNGVLTVVLKLLNLVQATRAYFGEKDYQQYLLIKKMVEAFFLPVTIVACETVRAEDGLALSSRNSRLTPAQRVKAALFPALLHSANTCEEIKAQLEAYGFKVEYIVEQWHRRLGAIWLDDVRLIDNIKI